MYRDTKLKKRKKGATKADIRKDIEPATKALVLSKLMVIFYPRDGKI